MSSPITLTYFSDVLCIWAHIAQARLDEISRQYPESVRIEYRFCSVFGDCANKIGEGWAQRGGYEGFNSHLLQTVAQYDHIKLHPAVWQQTRPVSSTPAHLLLKAVQQVDSSQCATVLHALRQAFFERCEDISHAAVLMAIVESVGMPAGKVQEQLNSGHAHAALEADSRDKARLMVQGSPTLILNDGRQKLYGNLGYGVIEANIKELLHSPHAGAASWC